MDKYTFASNPAATPAATVTGDDFRFTLISDTVLRYEWSEDGVFEDRPSTFAINRRFPTPEYSVAHTDTQVEIRAADFRVTYDKKRFSRHGLSVGFSNKNTLWGSGWLYGDVPENLGGTARTLDEINGRCELEPGVLSRAGYSVIDDSTSMLFDDNGFVSPRRPGDRIDGYLFCYGHDFKRAMSSFYAISGKQPMLPRWALGNWWSRFYPYTDQEYLKLMGKFDEQKVPLSVAVVDMDWHGVSGDNVPHTGWTGYSWNKELYPDPPAFLEALHKLKLKVTLNDHPHAGVHHHEDGYEDMAKAIGHDTSKHDPILFNPTCPEFMHAYLDVLHRSLEKGGCDFWWIDWQQGPISHVPGLDPLWLLNHFHYLDHQMQGNSRPLIFSRFAGPGSHRYPVGFSGDSIMTWESLAFQPEFTATAANIGYGWWSHDIGGHMHGYRDDELAARWVQFGVFSPIMRLHSSNSPWASKEPWLYGTEFAGVMQDFMRFRHRLLPYLAAMNWRSYHVDEPICQPLYWRYPSRDEAYSKPNQYYFGANLVVAPVVTARDRRTGISKTNVWVPPGRHVDVLNGLIYDGDRDIPMYRNIKTLPVLAEEGSIIPLDQNLNPGNGCVNPAGYEVLVVVGKDAEFTVRQDIVDDTEAGGKPQKDIRLVYSQKMGQLKFKPAGKSWTFKFVSVTSVPSSLAVSINGWAVPDVQTYIEEYPALPGLVVKIPEIAENNGSMAVLELGQSLELGVMDTSDRVRDLVLGYQVDMDLKDKIWKIVSSSRPVAVQVGQLMSLGEDEDVIGPLAELLVSDSR